MSLVKQIFPSFREHTIPYTFIFIEINPFYHIFGEISFFFIHFLPPRAFFFLTAYRRELLFFRLGYFLYWAKGWKHLIYFFLISCRLTLSMINNIFEFLIKIGY